MVSGTVISQQNIIWLIIAILGFITVIIVSIQWRRVRESQNDIVILEKQIELKKISLVENDLKAKRLMETTIPLPKEKQERLSAIRKDTMSLMHELGYLQSEISERLALLEAQTEFKKLKKMLRDIEKKEAELGIKLK
ncbi:hypothetical protein U2150_00855 [Methanothermobacter wolfeii]|uniref:Uncharacterized protein n=1 Tax=Methanothermobacter wolfeii TaxID=145261 RepID=A0A9E7UNW1_METWO|nr:hypothetical protein [Methanothermobacter wolfeii]QHN07290.1 hypothetical protein FZP57_08245 [Methanothermobacter sp. THM-1]UXH32647.1 hypothetical protein N5910_08710 [Methanothermobacter wolfeii]